MLIALKGFFLGASLIIAIGIQNAFVLRQGLKNRHVLTSALTASLADTFLISLGILGFGALVEALPDLVTWLKWFGAVFLILYGIKSLLAAFKNEALKEEDGKDLIKDGSIKETVLILLGVSFLNPHALLDTVVLIGGLGASYGETGKYLFGLGAALASFSWFFSLAYGARLLSPVFSKPKAWQVLDIIIAITMFAIAYSLIISEI